MPTADGEQRRLEDLVAQVLSEAREKGASAAEATLADGVGLSVSVRLGEVEKVEHDRGRGLSVAVYFEGRKGSASTSDLTPPALRDTVAAACSIARLTAPDDCHGLADSARMAHGFPDLDLFRPWALTAEQAAEVARECEAAALAEDPRITNSEGATVSCHRSLRIYGNSHGFLGGWRGTRHGISCAVVGRDPSGMQRDYWFTQARDPSHLETAQAVGQQAARRAARRLGSRKLETRESAVLFSPETARGLFGHLVAAVRGGALYRQASFLLGHLGKAVFPPGFVIREEPHLKGALGSAPFDAEGVATRHRQLVSDGILQGYVLDSYSARRLGMETTGNAGGIHNLLVEHGGRTQSELVALMGTGLLVTELMGMGVNTVTGDYSRGAAGFWVEGGSIQHPVHEITVAGNLRDIYRGIQAVGSDVDVRSSIRTGSVLVDHMTVAGS